MVINQREKHNQLLISIYKYSKTITKQDVLFRILLVFKFYIDEKIMKNVWCLFFQ